MTGYNNNNKYYNNYNQEEKTIYSRLSNIGPILAAILGQY